MYPTPESVEPPVETESGSATAAPLVVTPPLLTRIVAPHLRHLILTVFPWTFSSETVYLDWQDWQVIFMGCWFVAAGAVLGGPGPLVGGRAGGERGRPRTVYLDSAPVGFLPDVLP